MQCPGLFEGELIVTLDEKNKTIVFAMLAAKPDLEMLNQVFIDLCQKSFPQCIMFYLYFYMFN